MLIHLSVFFIQHVLRLQVLVTFMTCACSGIQSVVSDCKRMDCSLPGATVHGIFQARILEWIAVSSSRVSSQPKDQIHISYISYIGRQILYHLATWQALYDLDPSLILFCLPPLSSPPLIQLALQWMIFVRRQFFHDLS